MSKETQLITLSDEYVMFLKTFAGIVDGRWYRLHNWFRHERDNIFEIVPPEEVPESVISFEGSRDEYAKQQAIGFVKWLGENFDFNEFDNNWGKFWEIEEGNSGFDTTDIYDLFTLYLQSKNK